MSENAINTNSSGALQVRQPGNAASTAASASTAGNGPPVSGKPSPAREASVRAQELDKLVEELNSRSRSIGRSIRFQVDLDASMPIIQVYDRETGRLVRQIPADQAAVLASNRRTFDLNRVIDVV